MLLNTNRPASQTSPNKALFEPPMTHMNQVDFRYFEKQALKLWGNGKLPRSKHPLELEKISISKYSVN